MSMPQTFMSDVKRTKQRDNKGELVKFVIPSFYSANDA